MAENEAAKALSAAPRAGGRILALRDLYKAVGSYHESAALAYIEGEPNEWQAEALRSAWHRVWEAMRRVELTGPALPGEPGSVLSTEEEAELTVSVHAALGSPPLSTLMNRFVTWVLTHGRLANLTEKDVVDAMWPMLVMMAKAVAAHEHDREISALRDPTVAAAAILRVKPTTRVEAVVESAVVESPVVVAAEPEPPAEPPAALEESPDAPTGGVQGSLFDLWGKG